MKKLLLSTLLLAFLFDLAAQETAEVHLLRKTGYNGSLVAINLIMDGELLCKVKNKRHSVHQIEPGDHSFQAKLLGKKMKKKNKEPLELTFEAGKVYYLQLNLKQKMITTQVDVQEITESSAKRLIPDLKEENNCRA